MRWILLKHYQYISIILKKRYNEKDINKKEALLIKEEPLKILLFYFF